MSLPDMHTAAAWQEYLEEEINLKLLCVNCDKLGGP